MSNQEILVMIPTYSEKDSIGNLIKDLSNLDFKILIIDDNSPDGTADFVASLDLPNIDILRRPSKQGLGNAYIAGIKYALDVLKGKWNLKYLVSMDGDGSHQVSDLSKMVSQIVRYPNACMFLGSRWIAGGGIRNWSKFRITLSKAGTRYARWALKFPITDLTGGFRIYPCKTLEQIDLNQITSNGYSYQIEMAYAIKHLNREIIELPITFIERESGVSKMSSRVVIEAIWRVSKMGLSLRLRPNADKLHYVK